MQTSITTLDLVKDTSISCLCLPLRCLRAVLSFTHKKNRTNRGTLYRLRRLSVSAIFILVAVSAIFRPCFAQYPEPLKTHNLQKTADSHYTVIGNDPYFVLPLRHQASTTHNSELHLSLVLERLDDDERDIPLEVFFRPLVAENQTVDGATIFDPLFRIQFRVPDHGAEHNSFEPSSARPDSAREPKVRRISLPLPDDVSVDSSTVRFDIDSCQACTVSVIDLAVIKGPATDISEDNKDEKVMPQGWNNLKILNGAKPIPENGLELGAGAWSLNDMEIAASSLAITGGDPYLVSPIIDVATESLSGVLVEIEPHLPEVAWSAATPEKNPHYTFQLFYSTEKHQFTEYASTIMRLPTASDQAPLQFFIPLDFLSIRMPKIRLLRRLRLDIENPNFDNNRSHVLSWSFPKVVLIGPRQAEQYRELIPAQLLHSKLQKASRRQTLIGILKKISADLAFSISYTMLLLLVAAIIIQKFRSARDRS